MNSTRLLPKPLNELNKDYEKLRPKVISIQPFSNGSKKVKPGLTKITITFSKPLNGYNTGIDFGPLGEEAMPKISSQRIWAKDATAWTFEVDLKPNKHYQILISNNFRTKEGIRLKPYLIEISTTHWQEALLPYPGFADGTVGIPTIPRRTIKLRTIQCWPDLDGLVQ